MARSDLERLIVRASSETGRLYTNHVPQETKARLMIPRMSSSHLHARKRAARAYGTLASPLARRTVGVWTTDEPSSASYIDT